MGAVRPLGHREATNTAKVQVVGRQVGARDAALQGAGGVIIQVCPHARVGAPTSCSAGVGARARRHWAKNTSRSSTSRGPLTGGGIQVHASWPLAAHRCARLRRPWVGRFSDPDPRQAAASGHANPGEGCRQFSTELEEDATYFRRKNTHTWVSQRCSQPNGFWMIINDSASILLGMPGMTFLATRV